MQYMGGKVRISKPISEIINSASKYINGKEKVFVSLFCGSCSIESKVKNFDRLILNDNHEYLISMLKGVQSGYNLPETVSEDKYKYVRKHKNEDPVLTGVVGFSSYFGGKWLQGYAENSSSRDYVGESRRTLLKTMDTLQNAKFVCMDYRDVEIPEDSIVYADPPYVNTTRYTKEKFDSDVFWEYMREISKNHIVFISEQVSPNDFVEIWSKPLKRTLDVNKNNYFTVTEKLFVHKDSKYLNIKMENN